MSFHLDMQIRKIFKLTLSSFTILSAWLFGAFHFGQVISSETFAKYSLKSAKPQIETIDDLVKSNLSLLVLPGIETFSSIKKPLLDKIIERTKREKTILSMAEMYMDEQWIVDVSYGRSAMFFSDLPLKIMAMSYSKSLKPNTKFRFIEERYRNPFLTTIALSRRLPKKYREQFNLRYKL